MLLLARRRSIYFGWVLVGVLGITTIISYGTTAYAFGVLLAPIARDQRWSRADLSGAYALGILVAGVLGLPVGRAVDRFGGRALMSLGSALGGAVLLTLATVHEVGEFVLLWGVGLGLANALTFYPVSFTIVTNWFQRRRGAAMALLTTVGGLASAIFIPTSGLLVAHLGWRDTLLVLGLTQLVVALPLHVLIIRRHPEDLGLSPDGGAKEPAAESEVTANAREAGATMSEALRHPAFWLLTLAGGVDQLAAMVVWVHQIPFMIARGFDPVFAASIAGLLGLASLPGRFVLNHASDRFGARLLLILVLTTHCVGIVALILARSEVGLVAYVLVYGIAFGARSPLRASVMAEHFGRRAYGSITAAQGVGMAVPAAFGPLAAGWLYDRLGNYQLAFWLTAGAFAVAAALILLTPRPRLAPRGS